MSDKPDWLRRGAYAARANADELKVLVVEALKEQGINEGFDKMVYNRKSNKLRITFRRKSGRDDTEVLCTSEMLEHIRRLPGYTEVPR